RAGAGGRHRLGDAPVRPGGGRDRRRAGAVRAAVVRPPAGGPAGTRPHGVRPPGAGGARRAGADRRAGRRRRPDPGRRPLLERRLNGPTGPARPDRRAYTAPMALVGARRVEEARELLRGVVTETPLLHSRALSQIVGGPVLLKCENLQRTGS